MKGPGRAARNGCALILCAALLFGFGCSGDSGSPSTGPSQTGTNAQPPEVGANSDAWPLPNKDYANTRATLDGKITSANVSQLSVAWSAPIPGRSAFGAAATNPLIVGDTVLYQDLKSNVIALSLSSGEERWRVTYDTDTLGPNGVAVGYGKVFAARDPHTVVAISLAKGKELWSKTLSTRPGEGIDIQPVVYDNKILLSTVPVNLGGGFYQGGDIGRIFALDAKNGATRWSFDTVASDRWGNAEVNGGGGAWYPPGIDEKRGVSYWGTGNPSPVGGTKDFPGGSSRPGPNLYTSSVLALDHATGKLNWYQQIKPHDLFDLDFQSSPIIADLQVKGQTRTVVIGAGKAGRVVAFDAASGDILWNTPVGIHQNDEAQSFPPDQSITVYPGGLGGVETPLAFANGVVFVPIVNKSTTYTATGGLPPTAVSVSGATGEMVAINASTGEIVWEQYLPSAVLGGATVVNDLVFTSTIDGTVFALRRTDGAPIWTWKAPAGINGWPAIAGGTLIIPAGAGASPAIIALKLGSTAPGAFASPPAARTPLPASPGTPSQNLTISTPAGSASLFNVDTLTAPPNTQVTVTYTNNSDVVHNIHFFRGDSARAPSIAETPLKAGPNDVEAVSFASPGPGRYFFQCDVHPTLMTGQLVIQ